MRRIIRTLAILSLLGLGVYGYLKVKTPQPKVKVPTTRYNGYELNRRSIKRAKSFTVLISNEGFGGVGRGTGVLIDSKHVLTCAHMIEGRHDDIWIFPYPAQVVVKGTPVAVNSSEDLAILELSTPVVISHYATFQEAHYDGEPITIIGNTLGCMKWFVSFGIISGEFEQYLLTDGMIHGGNSGGPWIDERGEVVGLTDWGLMSPKGAELGISGGVSAQTINQFLKAWKAPSIQQILEQMLGGGQ